jgi:RimJ/RimL family protein N-acetyltransferase
MRRLILDEPHRIGPWVCARAGGFYIPEGAYAIGLEEDGEIIAGAMYDHYYAGASVQMHVAARYGRKWLNKEYLEIGFGYPFDKLNVKKIIGVVEETNLAAIRFDEHLGFTLETRIKDGCAGGDLLVYSMTREQCRFLKGKHETQIDREIRQAA